MSSETNLPQPFLGLAMRVVWQWVADVLMGAAARAGYDDVTLAHLGLFRYPGVEGQRLTDIAQRMQITKQSVHELINHLERSGYLVREVDPSNRRARLVRLTPKGQGLQTALQLQAQLLERRIIEILGDRRFADLQETLAILVDEITGGESADRGR